MISNSLDIISDLFNMGFSLNEKELKNTLSTHIRVEKGNIEGFLSLLEKRFDRICKNYNYNEDFVEEETGELMSKLEDFFSIFSSLMRLSESKYRQLFRTISEQS